MMLTNWRKKTALQRFEDDIQQRDINLKAKITEDDLRFKQVKGEVFKANQKSNNQLLKQFFIEFVQASHGEAIGEIIEGNETFMTSFVE